jgi:VanZ family protein
MPNDAATPDLPELSIRNSRAIACAVVVFIVYGSLYPFRYQEGDPSTGPVANLLSTWREWDHPGDLLSNVLLYIPFGFFASAAMPARFGWLARLIAAILLGALLSIGMELLQFHAVERDSSLGDVYANTIGSALGALLLLVPVVCRGLVPLERLIRQPPVVMLLAMWFGYRLFPYVPIISLNKYWHAIQPLLHPLPLLPMDLARFTVIWLAIGVMVEAACGFRWTLLMLPALIGAEIFGSILILDRSLRPPGIAGAALAFLLWLLPLRLIPQRRIVWRYRLLALAMAVLVTALRLEPFHLAATPHGFNWIPFHGAMYGSINIAMQAFFEKFFLYGSLIWLLERSGVRLGLASVGVAALLFATSAAETWLPGRSAEITDGLTALVIGWVFALLAPRPPGPIQADAASEALPGEPRPLLAP